jgi:DNA gyrase subunit A
MRTRRWSAVSVQAHAAADQLHRNLTCLIPTEAADIGRPERLDLHAMLWHFLHFRLEVVTRRLEHELESLKSRVHILQGFEKVFDALDEILPDRAQVGREAGRRATDHETLRSGCRADRRHPRAEDLPPGAARDPDHPEELEEKRRRIGNINALLKDEEGRWGVVRVEIEEMQKKYGDARRTRISSDEGEVEYTAEDFIVDEDNVVLVSRDGWVKRQKEVKDVSTTRVREGDTVLAVLPGSTRATVVFFSNFGVAWPDCRPRRLRPAMASRSSDSSSCATANDRRRSA